jgi:DNA-binding CsgD family transcriptional regulator
MYQPPSNSAALRAYDTLVVERRSISRDRQSAALITLSHTRVENALYQTMLAATRAAGAVAGEFSIQRLMGMIGEHSYSTIRRGLVGLQEKMSIERTMRPNEEKRRSSVYHVYSPADIFARRRAAGLRPYPKEIQSRQDNSANVRAVERVVEYHNLTRREAQIALCCIEGLTNGEIGEKLFVSEQTVKSHLRNVFVKMGIRRRTELVSRLLMTGEFV